MIWDPMLLLEPVLFMVVFLSLSFSLWLFSCLSLSTVQELDLKLSCVLDHVTLLTIIFVNGK